MVSIIIPVYNVSAYLKRCLDSVLAQKCSDWEAILVDDASTDGSDAVAEGYCLKDDRFRLLRQPRNLGQSAARNRGLKEATGEFVAFLDSDDWWENDFLEKHLSAIGGYDAVLSGYHRIGNGKVVRTSRPIHNWRFTSTWTKLYRAEAIKGLRFPEGHRYEDVLWTVDFLLTSPRIKRLNYIGYNYRVTPESTTSTIHEDDRHYVMTQLRARGSHPVVIYTRLKMILHFRRILTNNG